MLKLQNLYAIFGTCYECRTSMRIALHDFLVAAVYIYNSNLYRAERNREAAVLDTVCGYLINEIL